ncbi:Triacylglycerol lipase 2 [Nymphaea thermarum]|nr:Triacylglycerol lipase 2 [Nymphaea thermarum]
MEGRRLARAAAAMVVILLVLLTLNDVADGTSDVCKTVQSYGYQCSDNEVTTQDGYVLGLQRIASNTTGEKKQPPVLLQHGLLVVITADDNY